MATRRQDEIDAFLVKTEKENTSSRSNRSVTTRMETHAFRR